MSRVAKKPISVPKEVDVELSGQQITVSGGKGRLQFDIHTAVEATVANDDDGRVLQFAPRHQSKSAKALAGTTRAIINNMVTGVSSGFEKQLELVGVGYRAQLKGQQLQLSLGFSHPVDYKLPEGVTAETPQATVIILRAFDKQLLGLVAAEIRSLRPVEPYKGKGIRYKDERVKRKETKKK